MAFSNPVGGVITQSGTDNPATILTGLNALAGVTVTTSGNYSLIDLGVNRINVTGTMEANPNAVTFLGRNNSGVFNVRSTGTLTAISTDFSPAGLNAGTGLATRTSFENTFIVYLGANPVWHHSSPGTGALNNLVADYGVINIEEDNGVMLLDGVTITANTGFTIGADEPGTFTHTTRGMLSSGMINSNYIMPGYAPGNVSRGTIIQTFDENSTFELTNTRIVGGEYLPNEPVTISNLSRSGSTAALFNAGRGAGSTVIRDFDFRDNVNDYIYSSFSNNLPQTWMYNSSTGSELNISNPTTNGSGVFALYKEINTNVVDALGDGIDDVKVFIRDYNNGARKSTTGAQLISTATNTIDFNSFPTNFNRTGTTAAAATFLQTDDYIYEATTDGDGAITDVSYTNGTSVVNDATPPNGIEFMVMNAMAVSAGTTLVPFTTTFNGPLDNATKAVDKRTKVNTLGTDTIDAFTFKYENNIGSFLDLNLVGTGQATISETKIPDPGVTNTRAVTSALYTASAPTINNTGSVVLPSVALDLDQVYDLIKWNKTETGVTGYETPSNVDRLTINGLLRANPTSTAIVFGDALNITGNTGAVFTAAAALSNGANHSVVQFDTINMSNQVATGITLDTATLTNLGDTTDVSITVTGLTPTTLVPAAGATHTRLSLTNTTGVFNNLGAGVFTGGSLNSISLAGVGPITCTDTEFSGTEIGVTGNKVLTNTSGTPVILNSAGLTLTGNDWTSGSSISLTTGVLNLDGGSYTTALTGTITTDQTWTWSNLTANSIDFDISTISGGGIITINTNNAATLTEVQRWVATLTTTQQARFTVPVPAIQRTINVTIPTSAEGFITLRNLTDDTNESRLIASGVISAALPDISSEDTDSYRLYYKLESTLGGATYRTRIQDVPTGTADINIEPLLVNSFFTDGAQAGGTLGFTFAASTTADIIGTFSATSAAVETTRAISQGAAVAAANDDDYFKWIVANELLVDPIDYQPGSVLFNTSVDGVTTTDNRVVLVSNVNTAQTIINNWNGVITNDTGGTTISTGAGIRQVLNIPIGEADIATVTTAVSGTISAGLVSFWTSHTVGRGIRRAIGYLVSNLVSRIPRRQGFDNTGSSDTNYLNNL